MQLILYLIQKYRNFLLFFVLEIVALLFTIQLHSYQRSKFINASNFLSGGVYNNVINFNDYIGLKEENELLISENTRLKNEQTPIVVDSLHHQAIRIDTLTNFTFSNAQIINNNYNKQNNYITINKGKSQGISADMAVINDKGVIGTSIKSSSNYTSVISILNKTFRMNAKFKKNDFFGTLTWDGKEINKVQLIDIPRQADVKVGDTIVTGGKSIIFPENIRIGTISHIDYHNNRYQKIDVKLFNDMRNIKNVYIIKNSHRAEIIELEKSIND